MLRIEIPMLPPIALSPNARPHWAQKHRATQSLRTVAWACAYSVARDRIEKATIQPIFVVASKRRRDPDNWLAMLKPAIDGLVDAGILIDDDSEHVKLLSPQFVVDRSKAPMTVLEVSDGLGLL